MQPEHKMMTHFAVTRLQFRINFTPAEETLLPITHLTTLLLYNSLPLSLILMGQMFNCLDDRGESGISCGDLSAQSVTS